MPYLIYIWCSDIKTKCEDVEKVFNPKNDLRHAKKRASL